MIENFEWIKQVIKTAENDFQLNCCLRLIEVFHKKYSHTAKTRELYEVLFQSEKSIIEPAKNNQN